MFYSQVILAKKGPLAKVWLAAHWGDKKLARPQIFATDISASVDTIVNPTMPLALRLSGHLLLGVVRIYSRKVKYVLSDCTEAMLKLQMAFATASSGGSNLNGKGKELLDPSSTGGAGTSGGTMSGMGPHHTTIVNFGDYDQVHVVEDFCLPLPDQSEWILCEDDDDEDQQGPQEPGRESRTRIGLPVPTAAASPMAKYQPPQEETWVPFDPDHEDEEDEDDNNNNQQSQDLSQVSDVEIVRAAGDSFLSNDETRRASSLLGKSQTLLDASLGRQNEGNAGSNDEDEEMDFGHVPFDDDPDEPAMAMETSTDQPPKESSLVLHLSDDVSALDTSATIGLGDDSSQTRKRKSTNDNGDDDDDETDAPPAQKIKRRKRRKVVIDNDATELSNEHIRDMLADTSDLVSRQPHPADSPMEDNDHDTDHDHEGKDLAQDNNKQEFVVPSLTQPFLADAGYLHPSLTLLWKQNFYRALDLPCPYATLDKPDDVEQVLQDPQQQQQQQEQAMGDEEEENSDRDTSSLMQAHHDNGEENEESPDDFVPPPMDDEEEEEDDEAPMVPNLDESEEEGEQIVRHRATGSSGIGDLGLVNELELEDDDEDDTDDPNEREAVGEHVGNKWHKHTVKVLKLLQSRLRTLDDNEEEEQEAVKPTFLEFGELAKNVNRRTAASCFMECLQLKTWDFLDLVQDEEYGPITITAGPRFHEAPPNEA